jgi:hypothetical protein
MIMALGSITRGVIAKDTGCTYRCLLSRRNNKLFISIACAMVSVVVMWGKKFQRRRRSAPDPQVPAPSRDALRV